MLRRLSAVKGLEVADLASRLYNHLIALRIVLDHRPDIGKKYLDEVLAYPAFKDFKPTSPDLYNLLVLVLRQHDHADKIFNNWSIEPPELRLRKLLRSWATGDPASKEFNRLLVILQRQIPGLSPFQIAMRRHITSGNIDDIIIRRFVINMRETGIQSDLWQILRTLA